MNSEQIKHYLLDFDKVLAEYTDKFNQVSIDEQIVLMQDFEDIALHEFGIENGAMLLVNNSKEQFKSEVDYNEKKSITNDIKGLQATFVVLAAIGLVAVIGSLLLKQ